MAIELQKAYRHCQRVTRHAARNFYFAFLTLPPERRRAIYASYAFCRLCDDIADDPAPREEQVARLAEVRREVAQAYAGEPQGPVFTALAHAAATFGIPEVYFQEVIAGVEMDLTRTRYPDFETLRTYCYRVASTVGLSSVEVFGYRDPVAKEYAVDMGLAMQLTNIMRDLKEDAERGRVYLPQDELDRFGYSEESLRHGIIDESYLALMRFQAERARRYFDQGARLMPLLPRRSRACVAVLLGLYRKLLDRIEAQGFDVFHGQTSLKTQEKLLLTAKLWATSLLLRPRTFRGASSS